MQKGAIGGVVGAVLLIAIALAVAGCGGGGGDSSTTALTKAQYVKQANAICGDKSFYECIAKPFINGLFGKSEPSAAAATQ